MVAAAVALIAIAAPAHAQAPPSSNATAATQTPPPEVPKAASADTIKKARQAGYKTEVHNGVTLFCIEQVATGSHFKTKSCINQDQLAVMLERRQAAVDQLTNHSCNGCSGK